MLSIKHQTFNILNKYIEINGIRRISPNDVSRFAYAWEDQDKKKKMFNKKYSQQKKNITDNIDNIDDNKSYDKKSIYFCKNSNKLCPNSYRVEKNKNNNNNNNHSYYNLFSNPSIDKVPSLKIKEMQSIPTETDFSHLLKLMANEKQKANNLNENNTNKNNISNNIQINNDNNCNMNKESSHSFSSNFFNDKKKTNNSYEEGKTIILPKNGEHLLPTLNTIFDEKKAEEIKDEMKKTRKKENKKKIFSFGKKTAE